MLPVPEGTVFHNSPERAPWLLGGEGSNLQPPDSESGALPVELPPIGRTANLADPGPPRDGVPPRIGRSPDRLSATGPVPPEVRWSGARHYDRPVDTQRVVVVGGGVLGTMHALEACRRGWEVVHLEADAGPRRASVRNFGLVWVSGRAAGPELDLAVRARALWEQIAGHSPDVGFRPDGSLTVARHRRELALMAEAAARPDAEVRGFELLDPDGVRAVNPAVRGEVIGGLLCRQDAVVEPGLVLGALRTTLEATGRYTWLPRRQVVDVETGAGGTAVAVDHLGHRHEASVVVLCIGDRLSGLGGKVGCRPAAAPLRRCRLQMLQTGPHRRAPDHRRGRRRLDAVLPGVRPARAGGPARAGTRRRPSGACSSCSSSGRPGG